MICPNCRNNELHLTGHDCKYGNSFYDLHCFVCDIYYKTPPRLGSHVLGKWIDKVAPKYDGMDNDYIATESQTQLSNELKANRKPAIIPDTKFHDLFCETMKQISDHQYCSKTKEVR